jgi:hypothetical protein
MKTGNLKFALLLMAIAMVAGCTKPPTLVDNFYGTSYELAKQSQLSNPAAGIHNQRPEGMEGSVGKLIVDRYEAGFAQPAAKTESYSVSFEGMTKK